MDKRLAEGLSGLGIALPAGAEQALVRYAQELLRWNQKVNLTAITEPDEVVDKHLVDSLAVLPEVQGSKDLLDLGAGAGLPGIPLALALPQLQVTLVDAVAKKVGFMKHAIALLGLQGRVRAVHARAGGKPDDEGLPRAQVVICRALMAVDGWRTLGGAYVQPGGRLVAMLGREPGGRRYRLPSGDERGVVVFHVEH